MDCFSKKNGQIFSKKRDLLEVIAVCNLKERKSQVVKLMINFPDEMNSDIFLKKELKIVIDQYYNKRALLAYGLNTAFLSEN